MLDIHELQGLMGCGRTTAYARTQHPGFPAPVAFSSSDYKWWRHEVLEWLESKRQTAHKVRAATPARTLAAAPAPVPTPVVKRKR